MTPRELYEYAIKKGLADESILVQSSDATYTLVTRDDVGIIEFNAGPRVVIKKV